MKKLIDQTLKEYIEQLSSRQPVPGGGSVAALAGALGVGLIAMVANYSLGKNTPESARAKILGILKASEQLKKRLMALVDLDAQAYLQVVATRKSDEKTKKAALKKAREVPLVTCQACYAAILLTPDLVLYGNKYLLSDVEVAVEILWAAFHSAMINVKINS